MRDRRQDREHGRERERETQAVGCALLIMSIIQEDF